jgi:hypothetical protein
MRPQSIIMFERLFLASLALSAVLTAISYDEVPRLPTASMQQLGSAAGS